MPLSLGHPVPKAMGAPTDRLHRSVIWLAQQPVLLSFARQRAFDKAKALRQLVALHGLGLPAASLDRLGGGEHVLAVYQAQALGGLQVEAPFFV